MLSIYLNISDIYSDDSDDSNDFDEKTEMKKIKYINLFLKEARIV